MPPADVGVGSPTRLPVPDLLYKQPFLSIDARSLTEALGLAFMGRELGTQIHDALARAAIPRGRFRAELFAEDLFVRDLISSCLTLTLDHRPYPVNQEFLFRVLTSAPTDVETITFRQDILRELDASPTLLEFTEKLYIDLFDLTSLLKTPGYQSQIDLSAFHLDILKQILHVIDSMAANFAEAHSGLRRLAESATAMQQSAEYRTLRDLLEYESGIARLTVDLTFGGDGSIRRFAIRDLQEDKNNPFYKSPLRRLGDRAQMIYRGFKMSRREVTNRLISEVFRLLSPSFVPLIQLLGHLELYLTARVLRQRAADKGLAVCLAEIADSEPPRFERLFNPLLIDAAQPPVPCDILPLHNLPVVLVTGPNSGGKTRLLQALGLTQLLGQSGLYAPCAACRINVQDGLFVSLIEEEGARSTEGRLGRELMRIRSLFEELAPRSMVILDELCSGTNPSEGIEVFAMVLRLLRQVHPTSFVTTHFLDFARSLAEQPIVEGLEFLQVEVDSDLRSTYQFKPGVAATSLAAVTAERLGVTFERLAEAIRLRSE